MNQKSLAPRFFFTFCVGYASSLILDPSGNLLPYLSTFMILFGVLLGLNSASGKSISGNILLVISILPLAALNSFISSNPADSSLKWLLWLATLLGMSLLAKRSAVNIDQQLTKCIAPAFFIIWFVLALKGNITAETAKEKASSLHLSAFYANLLIASALFFPDKFLRIILVLLGIVGSLTSGSRASFLFFPLLILPGVIYHYRVRASTIIAISVVLASLLIIINNETLLSLTFGRKGEEITNLDSIELAQRSAEGRGTLREIGVEKIKQQPWGYGYGQSFEVILEGKSMGNNLHNGYLNVATQMGVHIFLIYIFFIIWLLFKLVTNKAISRLSRFFTLSLIWCMLLRAISESFSFFDLGHPASFLAIFLVALFIERLNKTESPRLQ